MPNYRLWSGQVVNNPTPGFWTPQRDQVDPTIPYLPLENPAAGGVSVTPTTLALVLATFAPTVLTPRLVTPTTLALVLSTFAPSVMLGIRVTPTTASLVLAFFAPTVSVSAAVLVTPATLATVLAFFAPTVTVLSTGTGVLVSQFSTSAGVGVSSSSGTGVLLSQAATLEGDGGVGSADSYHPVRRPGLKRRKTIIAHKQPRDS